MDDITHSELQQYWREALTQTYLDWRTHWNYSRQLETFIDAVYDRLIQPTDIQPSTETIAHGCQLLHQALQYIAEEKQFLSNELLGRLYRTLLPQAHRQVFIEQPEGEHLLACIALDYAGRAYDTFACGRSHLIPVLTQWTGRPFNFTRDTAAVGQNTLKDVADHLFGTAWTSLCLDPDDRFTAFQYKELLTMKPPFLHHVAEHTKNMDTLPDDFQHE